MTPRPRRRLPVVAGLLVLSGAPGALVRADTAATLVDVVASADATTSAARGARLYGGDDPALSGAVRGVLGTTAGGRDIVAFHRLGSVSPMRRLLVVGVIHGDETAGLAVTDLLPSVALPPDVELWWVPSINPDGMALGRHTNARGVDLNRNWVTLWEPAGGLHTSGRNFPGPVPASEAETQLMMAFIAALDPHITVWYHQPWGSVDCNRVLAGPECEEYAAHVGMSTDYAPRPGSATQWLMENGHGGSFVVELPLWRLDETTARRHVEALLLTVT